MTASNNLNSNDKIHKKTQTTNQTNCHRSFQRAYNCE